MWILAGACGQVDIKKKKFIQLPLIVSNNLEMPIYCREREPTKWITVRAPIVEWPGVPRYHLQVAFLRGPTGAGRSDVRQTIKVKLE